MRPFAPAAFAGLVLSAACNSGPIVDAPISEGNRSPSLHQGKKPGPDYVFLNGNIITMDASRRTVSAIAVDGDRILAVGSNGEIARLSRSNTRTINLQGRTVLPGFVDAHTHLFNNPERYVEGLAGAQRLALLSGITTLAMMGVKAGGIAEMRAFDEEGQLVVRTSLYLQYTDNCGRLQGDWWKSYPSIRVPGERLRIGGIKLFADGGTCGLPAVSQEFAPGSGLGDLFLTAADISDAARAAEENGHQMVVHAIGDRAVRAAQDGIAAVLGGRPNVLRHRIDHNSLVPEDLVGRYSEIGIIPVVFGFYHAAILEPRDDPGRGECPPMSRSAFYQAAEGNTRQIIDRNPLLPVAWHGDDPPIPPVRPLRELYGMVTRIQRYTLTAFQLCAPPEWLYPSHVSVMEGLTMMTINSAYAIFRDREVGSLEAGKFADLLVLSHDPVSIPPEQLWDVIVGTTMVGGEFVHCADGYEDVCPGPKVTGKGKGARHGGSDRRQHGPRGGR